MTEFYKWLAESALKPGRLATGLVLIFLAIFMGLLPSPMLSAITQVTREHTEIAGLLHQICVNTAKDELQIKGCYFRTGQK